MAIACASTPSSPRIRVDDLVHLPDEAVDQPGLQRGLRRLADHRRRRREVDAEEPCRAREQRVHRDLDPGRENAADVLPVGREDVEVRRRAEVDDDARRAVALLRGHGVRDPVGPDLARVVVADRHPGADARAHDERRHAGPALGELLVLADQRRHRRRQADAVDRVEVEQPVDQDVELVRRARRSVATR